MKSHVPFRILCSALVMSAALVTASCHDNDSDIPAGGGAPPPPPGTSDDIEGSVTLGPLNGATLALFAIAPNGTNGTQLGSGTVGNNGRFTLNLTNGIPTGPFRVCATGGTYADEATGDTLTNTLTTLCAVVPGGTRVVNLHVLTAMASQILEGAIRKLGRPATPAELNAALNDARDKMKKFAGLGQAPDQVEPRQQPPDPASDPNGDKYKVGTLLGGYSQLGERNADRCGNPPPLDRLDGLIKDANDGTFDGRELDPANPDNTRAVQVQCNGGNENLPVGTGTAELLTSIEEFADTPKGEEMEVGEQDTIVEEIRTAVATSEAAPPQVRLTPSQGLVAIDAVNNVAYAPVYSFDEEGNAQVAVVDLDTNEVTTTISLPDSDQPIASSFDALNRRLYVEGRTSQGAVKVYVIDPDDNSIIQTVDVTGVTHNRTFGGIIANPTHNKVIVVGTDQLAILDISDAQAEFVPTSVKALFGTDSICLNFDTQLLFNSSDGRNQVVDTTSTTDPEVSGFESNTWGITDGCAFDNLTNIMALDPEFQDQTTVFNFAEFVDDGDPQTVPATPPNITVEGFPGATVSPLGEGPGGQAAINVLTHQVIIADEFGRNYKVVQLPTAPVTGAPNNNGQPGTENPPADSGSAFTVAQALLPTADLSSEGGSAQAILAMRGDPNSLSVDPSRNFMYGLVDTNGNFNIWPAGSTTPLFLVKVNLANPVLGANPNTTTTWTPQTTLIRLP